MATKDTNIVDDDYQINLGVVELALAALRTRGPVDANGRAMVLCDERAKVSQVIDGKVITFTVSLYAQRDPLSDAEVERVKAVKAEKDAKAAERKAEEQGKREREISDATKRGTEGVIAGLKLMAEIGPQLQRASAIAKAVGLTDTPKT